MDNNLKKTYDLSDNILTDLYVFHLTATIFCFVAKSCFSLLMTRPIPVGSGGLLFAIRLLPNHLTFYEFFSLSKQIKYKSQRRYLFSFFNYNGIKNHHKYFP
jgi:hypothetical protein